MTDSIAARTENLVKSFGVNAVLQGCTMTVPCGTIYGLMGANGAGKTTLFKLLTGLLFPDMGSIEILGMDLLKNREQLLSKIGSLIETPVFYEHLTARKNLELHLEYMGVSGMDIDRTLTMVGLSGIEGKPVSRFSLGMRQKLAIARAFIHQPQVLILDEPINGLDPVGIKDMRNLFLYLAKEKDMTVLLSSHNLSELEHVADRIGVISGGKIVNETSLAQLKAEHTGSLEDYFFTLLSGGKTV